MPEALDERLVYIDFRLMFLGSVSRQDICSQFSVSEPAATRDLATYREKWSANLEYSHIERTYLVTDAFVPMYPHSGEQALSMIAKGYFALSKQGGKPMLRCDLPIQLDFPDAKVVAAITRAISRKKVISLEYRSHSSGKTKRQIAPFALIDNGLRWHIRAFDRRRKRFSDFVIARISNPRIEKSDLSEEEQGEQDIQWNRVVELELVPHPKRPHAETPTFEYQMKNGVMTLKVRAAVAGYFLRRWNVDCSADHSLEGNEYQLWLRNREALYGVETLEIAPGYSTSKAAKTPGLANGLR